MVLPKNCRTPLKRWNPSSKFYSPNRLQLLQERFTLDFQPRRVSRRRTPALKKHSIKYSQRCLDLPWNIPPAAIRETTRGVPISMLLFCGKQFFFSVRRLRGFRQVVQHVSEHVAIVIN